jgi:ABC-type multidrug transport system fused ATPase/permease subunit
MRNQLLRNPEIRMAIGFLHKKDRGKIGFIVSIQIFLSLLDVVGVALIGVLGSLTITGIQSSQPGNRINIALNFLNINNLKFQIQVTIIGLLAAGILLSRTFISVIFTRKILLFFARRSAQLSSDLISKLLGQNILTVQARSSQETLFALTHGVNSLMVGVLANIVTLISDLAILFALTIALMVVDPLIAIFTILVFSLISLQLNRLLNSKAQQLGKDYSALNIIGNAKIMEVLNSYRESVVHNRRGYYSEKLKEIRLQLASAQAEVAFMPNISKYVIETAIIIISILVAAIQFMTQNASHAFATLTFFMAAASRLAPALLRIQQGLMSIKNNLGSAVTTTALMQSMSEVDNIEVREHADFTYRNFIPKIELKNITFTYPNENQPAISNVNLQIQQGSIIAFVGSSGAGKTTLVDLILGVLKPDSGQINVSNLPPLEAISKWAGAISYVPQDIYIVQGTIRENIALGYPDSFATDSRINETLRMSDLFNDVSQFPNGIDTYVGESGSQLSGGQRQRLGIARALFSNPLLIVLDESTSSLDSQTELRISQSILSLKGSKTLVLIAHRLSTIRNADQIFYLEKGKILASGTFEEVRLRVPQFDQQAKLLGL